MTEFYKYQVSIIQRHWEGYKCRKNVMDYYANRKWLEETKKKNEETLNEMRELSQKKQYDLDRQIEENQRRNFVNIAKNFHHLFSTRKFLVFIILLIYLQNLNHKFIMLILKNI